MSAAEQSHPTALQQAAHAYAEHGVAIFPVAPRDKLPALPKCAQIEHAHLPADCGGGDGHGFHDATTDTDTIGRWWTDRPDANIGIALGANDVFVLDVDGPAGRAALDELEQTYTPLPETYQVVTGRSEGSGRHHIFRQPAEGPRVRNRKVADHLETRGDGGYVVAPPSVHPSGRPYMAIGRWDGIADAPAWLIGIATHEPQASPAPPAAATSDPARQRAEKRLTGLAGKVAMAPEGERNSVLNHAAYTAGRLVGADVLDEPHVVGQLLIAAARAGLEERESRATIASGVGAGRQDPEWDARDITGPAPAPTVIDLTAPADLAGAPDGYVDRPSSWVSVDIHAILSGDYRPPQPTALARSDGPALLYQGMTNALFGESESGKSWVALHACAQLLMAGRGALYIDFEASGPIILGRLAALGVPVELIVGHFAYISPDEPLAGRAVADLTRELDRTQPELAVIDGVTGAMGLHGWSPLDNADAERFDRTLPRPLADAGPAVVMVDHIPKARDGVDNKYAMGAQHKRAAITGAAYRVDLIAPLAPGRVGKLKLTISKDRHGAVRAQHPTMGGAFVLDSSDAQKPRARLDAPPDADKPFRPTHLMEKVSRLLEGTSGPLPKSAVTKAVTGKDRVILQAIEALAADGYIVVKTVGSALMCTSVRPYRDEEEL